MRIRNTLMLAVVAVSLLALAVPANAVPSLTVVVNEVQTRGDNGGNDEFIELRNVSSSPSTSAASASSAATRPAASPAAPRSHPTRRRSPPATSTY